MKYLRPSSEEEMVGVFLKAELSSPRFSQKVTESAKKLKIPISIISEPDIKNREENHKRSKLLTTYRGWEDRSEMFSRVPQKAEWNWYELEKADVLKLHYVDYSYWNELSGGSHLVREGVAKIKSGIEVFGVSSKPFLDLAREIDRKGLVKPLILYKFKGANYLEIIEGHLRATSIGLSSRKDIKIEAIVGKNWGAL